MRFEPRACRCFQPPFASDCAYVVLRGGFFESERGLLWRIDRGFAAWLASIPAERQRFAAALQQGWHFTATGFGR